MCHFMSNDTVDTNAVTGKIDLEAENKQLQELYNEVDKVFPALKQVLDKYPKCFQLDYHSAAGYFIDYDVNALVLHLRVQD